MILKKVLEVIKLVTAKIVDTWLMSKGLMSSAFDYWQMDLSTSIIALKMNHL